jgi:hypothetical protein
VSSLKVVSSLFGRQLDVTTRDERRNQSIIFLFTIFWAADITLLPLRKKSAHPTQASHGQQLKVNKKHSA